MPGICRSVTTRFAGLHSSFCHASWPSHDFDPKDYFVYEREGAALINWAPCVDPLRCPSLGPGDRVVIHNAAIGGYAPGKGEAIVWWWRGPSPPGLDDIHAIVVSLQAS